MTYERPNITIIVAELSLLQSSEMVPGATDIGAPSVRTKSVWDEVEQYNNNKEEQDYENWE